VALLDLMSIHELPSDVVTWVHWKLDVYIKKAGFLSINSLSFCCGAWQIAMPDYGGHGNCYFFGSSVECQFV